MLKEGEYKNGKKTGNWLYYDENGEVNKSQDIDKIIKHGNNGFICENNTKSFYEILKYCIELDEKTYKNISIRAKKTINEKFNNNIWNNKMDLLLRKIL